MSKLHRVVAKHNKYSTIPVHTFYFEKPKDLIKATETLFEAGFKLTLNLRIDLLTIKELKRVYFFNPLIVDEDQLSCKTKKELMEKYEENYGS